MSSYFHYTTVEAFFEIVRSGKLRATSLEFLNDPRELNLGYDIAVSFLKNLGFPPRSREQQHLQLFKKQFMKIAPTFHPFSISFSKCEDALPQWLAYSNSGQGVCFEFSDFPFMSNAAGLIEAEVAYTEDEFRNFIEEHFFTSQKSFLEASAEEIEDAVNDPDDSSTYFFNDIHSIRTQCAAYKHESWSHEDEVRGAAFAWMFDKADACNLVLPDSLEEIVPNGIEFSPRGSQLVPFLDVEIPRTVVEGTSKEYIVCEAIWLGPNCQFSKDVVGAFLNKYNWVSSRIKNSNCLVR